jgi:uncharacterized protein YndB with AHSA1/START domain
MGSEVHEGAAAVRVTRTFRAAPAVVFKALTDPEMLAEWFARAPGTPRGKIVTLDVRPGGTYLIEVVGPEDHLTYRMQGTYREIVPRERLSFTWWYDRADFDPSLVTIELRATGDGGTELTLTHALLPERMREPHRQGWEECLTNIETAIAATSATA